MLLEACPVYAPTPLVALDGLAPCAVLVKDETGRMGLGSFKALGGVYAVAALLHDRWLAGGGAPLTAAELRSEKVRQIAAGLCVVCASAGNHGLAVAAGARLFGVRARVHLSFEVAESFAGRLGEMGAQVRRSGTDYDASLAAAMADAEATGAVLLADTAPPGPGEPPSLVMEGYTVLAEELRHGFEADGGWPSYVFLQAGVGGLAASMAHMIRMTWAVQPQIAVVEPEAAPCLKASVEAGRAVRVEGPVSTMGRLDCKLPSDLALEVLARTADHFCLVSDDQAAAAASLAAQHGLATTPSGAAGLAGLLTLVRRSTLSSTDSALVFISEGPV